MDGTNTPEQQISVEDQVDTGVDEKRPWRILIPTHVDPNTVLNTIEAGKLFSLPMHRLVRLRNSDDGPRHFHVSNKVYLYRVDDVAKWLWARRQTPFYEKGLYEDN